MDSDLEFWDGKEVDKPQIRRNLTIGGDYETQVNIMRRAKEQEIQAMKIRYKNQFIVKIKAIVERFKCIVQEEVERVHKQYANSHKQILQDKQDMHSMLIQIQQLEELVMHYKRKKMHPTKVIQSEVSQKVINENQELKLEIQNQERLIKVQRQIVQMFHDRYVQYKRLYQEQQSKFNEEIKDKDKKLEIVLNQSKESENEYKIRIQNLQQKIEQVKGDATWELQIREIIHQKQQDKIQQLQHNLTDTKKVFQDTRLQKLLFHKFSPVQKRLKSRTSSRPSKLKDQYLRNLTPKEKNRFKNVRSSNSQIKMIEISTKS